jgi:hypothetical protein
VADGDESLLDVFVNIRPDPNFQDIIRTSANEAIAEYARIFSSASIPSPRLGPPNVSGGGTGGGGGGNAGGGGTGGGGRGTLAQEYRDAARALEDLQRNLRTVSRESSLSGIVQFDDEVKRLQDQLSDLVLNVRRQTQDRDLLGIQASLQYVEPLRQEILRVFQDVSNQRPLKEQFDLEVGRGREAISEGRITNRLEASLVRGLPSAEIRRSIAIVRSEIELAEADVRRLSAAFNGTQDSVENLSNATQILALRNQELREVYANAQQVSQSMNTLSNNAYQMGQAFEDFAVGFSLNGIAGGIRGSANNVAFILNDLSRMPALQSAIGQRFANMLPLVAGVGSALAITVLPALVEWLESLDDIETKFTDLSDVLSREFSDIKFNVDLQGGEREFLRSIEKAKELRDVLQQLGDVAERSGDKSADLQKLFSGLDEGDTFANTLNSLREANSLFEEQRIQQERIRDAARFQIDNPARRSVDPVESRAAAVGAVTSQQNLEAALSQLGVLEPQIQNVTDLYNNLRIARENGIAGATDPDQVKKTVRLFDEVKKAVESTFKELDLADEEAAAKFTATLTAVQEVINELSRSAQEIESFSNQLVDGLTSAQAKIDEFTDTQEVIRRTIAGTANDQTLFTLEVQRSAQEFQTLIEKIREARLALAPSQEIRNLVNREADASREALRIETETELLLRQKDVRDEIEKISEKKDRSSGKSALTNFEQFAQNLQKNVLSNDPLDRNTQQLEKLNQELATLDSAISELNANMRIGGSPSQALRATPLGGFGNFNSLGFALESMSQIRPENFNTQGMPDATANAISGALNMAFREAMREFVTPVVGAQGQTTDAVRRLNVGAVAQ